MQLTSSELELVRFHPTVTELYLSVFQPTTIFQAQINSGSITKNARVIPFDTVLAGGYLSIESGMTLLIGTTPGARDVGKIRVRSATVSTITVSENSNIMWADNLYLTVLRYWELWPVYPRIIPDPSNGENVLFFKDYDVVYTNQNSILGTLQCAGSHLAGWVGDSFYFTSTGTTHLLGSALTHDWAFEGATVTGSTSAIPGNITWNTPGHYVVRYKSTGANGSVDTTYRYVSIYNRPENSSSNNPIKKWEIGTVSGGRDEAGYSSSLRAIDENFSINEGDVVVLFSENWYGGQKISLGSNSSNATIFFSGHIQNGSISFDYKSKQYEFEVVSVTIFAKSIEGFSVSVESKAVPSTWFELLNMDGRRALYHYLRWHSTLLNISDFQFFGTDQNIQYFDSDRTSIYDAIDNYMRGTLEGKVVADLQGKVFAEVSAYAYLNPTGSFPTVMSITKRDWIGEPNIPERLTAPVSFVERGGVAYAGPVTGSFDAFLSNAPGPTPAFRGSEDKAQGLAIASQSQLNILTGNIFANKNVPYPEIGMNLAGNYRNLDIAPQNAVGMDINVDDTNRRIEIHAPYIVDTLSWSYNPKNKTLLTSPNFKSLVNGFSGETIGIPPVQEISLGGGFNVPHLKIPSLNPLIPSLGTGIRSCGLRMDNYSALSGTGTMYAAPASRFATESASDPTIFSDSTYPIVANSGYYLIIAYPFISYSSVSATLIFTPPGAGYLTGNAQMPFVVSSALLRNTWSRTVYYTAGQTIKFDIWASTTPGAFEFMSLNLWVTKLT